MSSPLTGPLGDDLRQARRLAWWTIGWMISVIAIVGATAGSSQAMKTAWLEDILSLIPAVVFLVALRQEGRAPNERFPHGFLRANGIAFLVSAVALSGMGGFLLVESLRTLAQREHVSILPLAVGNTTVWSGWLMIGALLYSVIPPVLLARRKLPLARRLQDKVLHTDAMMQKADWMTGAAGAAGVLGVGLGLWWADALAAGVISFSILHDGIGALRTASAELIDGAPRSLDGTDLADDARALIEALRRDFPGAVVRVRDTGRYIRAEVSEVDPPTVLDLDRLWPGPPERRWRLAAVSFVPRSGDA
ncbi:MAG TPA: cation transporter [Luteitalea sp.]|nr:cation transporter [Luteitalea sp.]